MEPQDPREEGHSAAYKRRIQDRLDMEMMARRKRYKTKYAIVHEGRDENDPNWVRSDDSSDDDDNEMSYCNITIVKTKKKIFCVKASFDVPFEDNADQPGPSGAAPSEESRSTPTEESDEYDSDCLSGSDISDDFFDLPSNLDDDSSDEDHDSSSSSGVSEVSFGTRSTMSEESNESIWSNSSSVNYGNCLLVNMPNEE